MSVSAVAFPMSLRPGTKLSFIKEGCKILVSVVKTPGDFAQACLVRIESIGSEGKKPNFEVGKELKISLRELIFESE